VVSGVGDLVLDHLRRLAGIFGVDDDLRIGEIGNSVERRVAHSVDAGEDNERSGEQHRKVLRADQEMTEPIMAICPPAP